MRAGWTTAAVCALCAALLAAAALLPPALATRAFASDSGVVNSGNAQHLGPAEQPPAETQSDENAGQGNPPEEVAAAHGRLKSVTTSAMPTATANGSSGAGATATGETSSDVSSIAPDTSWALPKGAGVPGGAGCCACNGGLQFFGPLPLTGTHPPLQMFLSPPADVATVLPPGEGYFRADLDMSNIVVRHEFAGAIADWDMETERLLGNYHRGAGRGEFYASLPLVLHTHGFMDQIIRGYHSLLGFPSGIRGDLANWQYHYIIITRQGPVVNDQGGFGIGDLTVGYKLRLFDHGDGRSAAALRVAAKLPTGDVGKVMGSGNADFDAGVLYQRQLRPHLRAYVNYDYVLIGKPRLQNINWRNSPVLMLGSEYAVSKHTTVSGVYSDTGQPLHIGAGKADWNSQQLSFGFQSRLKDRRIWSGGFSEDIHPETAPDFVVNTALKWEF